MIWIISIIVGVVLVYVVKSIAANPTPSSKEKPNPSVSNTAAKRNPAPIPPKPYTSPAPSKQALAATQLKEDLETIKEKGGIWFQCEVKPSPPLADWDNIILLNKEEHIDFFHADELLYIEIKRWDQPLGVIEPRYNSRTFELFKKNLRVGLTISEVEADDDGHPTKVVVNIIFTDRPKLPGMLLPEGYEPKPDPEREEKIAEMEEKLAQMQEEMIKAAQVVWDTETFYRRFSIVGCGFLDDEGKAAVAALDAGDVLTLRLEPENEYSNNAVAVYTDDGIKVGHVEEADNIAMIYYHTLRGGKSPLLDGRAAIKVLSKPKVGAR